MSLAIVTNKLLDFAKASAARAKSANDPDSIQRFCNAEQEFRILAKMAHDALISDQAWRGAASRGLAGPGLARRGGQSGGRSAMGALQFWALHGQAVQNTIGAYGPNWKVCAPFGETLLVTVPSKYRSALSARGTKLRWGADHRMPAASYWPDKVLPRGLVITADYPRSTGRAEDEEHDDAWHLARGYVLNLGMWVSEIGLRASQQHQENIEANRLRAEQAKIEQAALDEADQASANEAAAEDSRVRAEDARARGDFAAAADWEETAARWERAKIDQAAAEDAEVEGEYAEAAD